MCITKDLAKEEEIETNFTRLIKQIKAKHFNSLFSGNKLNFFKTWQGICEIININRTKSKEINCT